MQNNENLISGNINKIYYKYLINSILGVLAISFAIFIDTMFIGRGIGSEGLSALNIAIPIFNLLNGLGLLFGMGGATALSISRGRDNNEEANEIFTQTIIIMLSLGILISIIGVINVEKIAYILGASKNNLDFVTQYLKGVLFVAFSYISVHGLASFVRNDSNPGLVMIATISGGIVNIVLDYLFIFEYKMGMLGASMATSIASLVNLTIISTHFITKKCKLKLRFSNINIKFILRVLGNGAPSFIIELSSGIVIIVFNIAILNMIGEIGVSAYSIVANVALIVMATYTGIAQAMQPIISVNYGAMQNDRIKSVIKRSIIIAVVIGLSVYTVGVLYPNKIVSIFTTDSGEIVNITINAIKYYFISFVLMGYNIIMGAYYQAIEKRIVSNLISIGRGILFLMIGIIILPNIFGINGIWLSVLFSELITYVFILIYKKKTLLK